METGNSVSLESNASSSDLQKSTEESSYDLLLKQQQMFLQWQLENELEKVYIYTNQYIMIAFRFICNVSKIVKNYILFLAVPQNLTKIRDNG